MTKRLLSLLAVLCLGAVIQRPALAQPAITPTVAFKVLNSIGTPDEQTYLQTITAQLRTKTADAKFAKSLDDAVVRRDYATAGRLIAETIGTKSTQVTMVINRSLGFSGEPQSLFRLASNVRPALNPWYLIFTVGGRVYCASTSAATCHDALHKMGYSNTEQIW